MTVNGGTKVVDSQFTMLSELLMRELLKLDTVEAEGEAKVQRKIEVSVYYIYTLVMKDEVDKSTL